MQVAETEILSLVDDDGVGVRYVQSVLYNGGTEHHIVVTAYKLKQYVFHLSGFHLSVGNAYLDVRKQTVKYFVDGV